MTLLLFTFGGVGRQVSGALKIDLSGLAKLTGKVGGVVMEVLNAAQYAVDLAFRFLNDVDVVLEELETSITTGPFADGVDLAARLVDATENLFLVIERARASVALGNSAMAVSTTLNSASDTATDIVSTLSDLTSGYSSVATSISSVSTTLDALLTDVTAASQTLNDTLAILQRPFDGAGPDPVASAWTPALLNAQALGPAVGSVAVSVGKLHALAATRTGPVAPLLDVSVATAAASAAVNYTFALGLLQDTEAAARDALDAYTSGSLTDAQWVARVTNMVPQLTANRDGVVSQVAAAAPILPLAKLLAGARASAARSRPVVCGGEASSLSLAASQVLALLDDRSVNTSAALASLKSALGAMSIHAPSLAALSVSYPVLSTLSGPTQSVTNFTESLAVAGDSIATLVRLVDSLDTLQSSFLSHTNSTTWPVESAAVACGPFVDAVQGLVLDPAFADVVSALQSELESLYAGVSEYTSDAATIRDIVVRIIRVVDKFPTFRAAADVMREGVKVVQTVLDAIETPFNHGFAFLKGTQQMIEDMGSSGTGVGGALVAGLKDATLPGLSNRVLANSSAVTQVWRDAQVFRELARAARVEFALPAVQRSTRNALLDAAVAGDIQVDPVLAAIDAALSYRSTLLAVDTFGAVVALVNLGDTKSMCGRLSAALDAVSALDVDLVLSPQTALSDVQGLAVLLTSNTTAGESTATMCIPCIQAALTSLRADAMNLQGQLQSADALVRSAPALVNAADATNVVGGRHAAIIAGGQLGPGLQAVAASASLTKAGLGATQQLLAAWTAANNSVTAAQGRAATALNRLNGTQGVVRASDLFIQSANVSMVAVERLQTDVDVALGYTSAMNAFLNADALAQFFEFAVEIPVDGLGNVFDVVRDGVRILRVLLEKVREGMQFVLDKVELVRGVIGDVRRELLALVQGPSVAGLISTPVPTCANATDATVPPCLHSVYRSWDVLRTYVFPLNSLLLYLLTHLGQKSWVVPGMFDGYVLAGVTFAGYDASGSVRFAASVYNADESFHHRSLPPIIVMHDSDTGELLRVLELYQAPGVALAGTVTGVTKTWSDTVIVSVVVNGAGALVGFSLGELVAEASGAKRGSPAGVLVAGVDSVGYRMYLNLRPEDIVPYGGVSFYRKDGDCRLMLFQGDAGNTTLVIPISNCKWIVGVRIKKDGLEYPLMPQAFTLDLGPNIVGASVFQDEYGLVTYAGVLRCVIQKGYDCRVSFVALNTSRTDVLGLHTWSRAVDPDGSPSAAVYELSVPSGAVGLGWDGDARDFLIGFSGGADKNAGLMKSAGRLMEDRIMVIDMPILKTVAPGACLNVSSC